MCLRSQWLPGHFVIEYLCENEKFRVAVFACSYGALEESFKKKQKCLKSRGTVLFRCNQKTRLWIIYNVPSQYPCNNIWHEDKQ